MKRGGVLLALAVSVCSTNLVAQTYDDPSLGDQPVIKHPQDHKPLGIRAGNFMLHPGVQLAVEWNDNVFYTDGDEISDTIYHIRPYVTAQSNWSRHAFNVRLAADFAFYNDFSERDYEDYFFNLDGRVDVKTQSYFTYHGEFLRLHEGLNTRSSEQGIEPTTYRLYGAGLGYDHTFNRFSVGIAGNYQHLDFDDTLGFDGLIIDNQDRDRDVYTAYLRGGYQFQVDKQLFATIGYAKVRYDDVPDRNGYYRDNEGWWASVGMDFAVTAKLSGDFYVSYRHREYDDLLLPDVDGWGLGAGLTWTPTNLTRVYFNIDTGIEETTLSYASGYFRTLYSLRAEHDLTRSLQLTGHVGYYDNKYELIAGAPEFAREHDKIWRYGVGLNWFINRWLFLGASYDRTTLNSNVPFDDYKVNRVWVVLGLER